ncbi:alpha/beta hydrolase fold domain-containing protein [Kineococcus arenarius]|uniref:alpha/beta hydrolase fold domain-containing protein n=1 Tax=unclassified Kineococcus TaxID=2621656 RepID=UPI003D7E21E2
MTTSPTRPLVEPRDVPLEEFPASPLGTEGMHVLTADPTPRYGSAVLGVEYARKSGRALHLQVLLPPVRPGSTERFPLVVYVQGSAWFEQRLGQELPALADFTRRGYVVAIVEYRPSTVAPFPAQVRDAGSAVRFLRRNAERFHVDPERVVLWGDSSGGHTTVLAHLTDGDQEYGDEPVDAEPLALRCAIDYYGPSDISRMNEEPSIQDHVGRTSPEGMLIGGVDVLENPELVRPTVAMNHVTSTPRRPPLLVVHGSKDRIVPFGQSVLLVKALQEAGQPVTFYRLEGADHAGPAFWTGDVLDVVDAFIRENL